MEFQFANNTLENSVDMRALGIEQITFGVWLNAHVRIFLIGFRDVFYDKYQLFFNIVNLYVSHVTELTDIREKPTKQYAALWLKFV